MEILRIRLLTVEDDLDDAPEIYLTIHRQLSEWLFVKKNIVKLVDPEQDQWVTNLQDWRKLSRQLCRENDLVFCTVDLQIPESAEHQYPEQGTGIAY